MKTTVQAVTQAEFSALVSTRTLEPGEVYIVDGQIRRATSTSAHQVVGGGVAGVESTRAVAMVGQSNERGSARTWAGPGQLAQATSFRDSYGVADPVAPSVSGLGSVIPLLNSQLAARGHNVIWRNCAIGGSSFIRQWCGQVTNWAANTGYHGQRSSIGAGDAGDYGDVIVDGNRVFRCTAGRARYASNNSGNAIPSGGGATNIDYIIIVGSQTSGATKPAAFATAAVNDVIVDGGVTWTCIATSLGTLSAFKVLAQGEFGFDPLGLLARTKAQLDGVSGVAEKWVFMANGQSDAQGSLGAQATVRAWYRQAIENMALYFVGQGFRVAVGFTCYNPTSPLFADAVYTDQYQTLRLGINDAFAGALAGNANIIRGGDLYERFGYSVRTYPEPPATAISVGNAPHMIAAEYPAYADEWVNKLAASGRW